MKKILRNSIRKLPVTAINYVLHKEKGRDYVLEFQKHDVLELIYVDYGKMELFISRRKLYLDTGMMAIIPSNKRHRFCGVEGRPFDFLNITFYGKIKENVFFRAIPLSAEERELLAGLKKEYLLQSPFHYEFMLVLLNELILLLQRRLNTDSISATNVEFLAGNSLNHRAVIIAKAMNYISDNFMRPLSADAVSRHAGISVSHLRKLMREETGLNLRHHIRAKRIEAAKKFLRESADTINVIAARVGYPNFSKFTLAFRKVTGMTPRAYSKSLGDPTARK